MNEDLVFANTLDNFVSSGNESIEEYDYLINNFSEVSLIQ